MHRYEEAIRYAEKALAIKKEARTSADASFAHTTAGNWAQGRSYAVEALKLIPSSRIRRSTLPTAIWPSSDGSRAGAGSRQSEGTKWRKEYTYGDTEEWQGEPDAMVMVTGEQGLGDEVMMAGVIPDAIKACKQFIFDCDPRALRCFGVRFPRRS